MYMQCMHVSLCIDVCFKYVCMSVCARMSHALQSLFVRVGITPVECLSQFPVKHCRQVHVGYFSLQLQSLCARPDESLFSTILSDPGHILHGLVPPVRKIGHTLRLLKHNRTILHSESDTFTRKGFITRMQQAYSYFLGFRHHLTIYLLLLFQILLSRCFLLPSAIDASL